jgi:hypothetical protein
MVSKIRKSDGARVKIGTCESMYYLRLEDRDAVTPERGSGFGWYWRLPFPDEDHILPGDYGDYSRGERLWKKDESEKPLNAQRHDIDFADDEATKKPGRVQLHHDSSLLLSVACYHGGRLAAIAILRDIHPKNRFSPMTLPAHSGFVNIL